MPTEAQSLHTTIFEAHKLSTKVLHLIYIIDKIYMINYTGDEVC